MERKHFVSFQRVTAALSIMGKKIKKKYFYNRYILSMPIRITGVEMHVLYCKSKELNLVQSVTGGVIA